MKITPEFKTVEEEYEFWETHDHNEYDKFVTWPATILKLSKEIHASFTIFRKSINSSEEE